MSEKRAKGYKDLFAGNIKTSLKKAVQIFAKYPSSARAVLKVSGNLIRSEHVRAGHLKEGIEIPHLMIVSTTEQCNLSCAGCYSCAHQRKAGHELDPDRIKGVMQEASDLGVAVVMLAGGEPFLNVDWIQALGDHNELLGIVFTNGTLLDEEKIQWLLKNRHVIPTISIEGTREQTDARRGDGVYEKTDRAMALLRKANIPFGVSVTATSSNMDTVCNETFIEDMIQKGCRLFVFVEYVPIETDNGLKVLSLKQKQELAEFCFQNTEKYPALFIAFPGNEDEYGGCLAAGRGFIHVSARGDVEPCPFAPVSDRNLSSVSLKEALQSDILAKIRENHHLLKEGEGGCSLWHNRELIKGL